MFWFHRNTRHKKNSKCRTRQPGLFIPRVESLEDRRLLSVIPVTTFADVVNALDGVTSLREAVNTANATPGLDSIVLKNGTYKITILGADEDLNATGDFDITESVNIIGAKNTVVDAAGVDRVFDIPSPATGVDLTFNKVKITGGLLGALLLDQNGAGVHAGAVGNSMTFTDTTITGNTASIQGGGVYNAGGDITLKNSHVDKNNAGFQGGGIWLGFSGLLTINHSTVNGNTAAADGGGFLSGSIDDLSISDSEISRNRAGGVGGGGAALSENVTIDDSCFTYNTAGTSGGGLTVFGPVGSTLISISDSTFSRNRASVDGGGIEAGQASVIVDDSNFCDNQAGVNGGAISNTAAVSVSYSDFKNNSALAGDGGAIHQIAPGDIDVYKSLFKNNFAGGYGGAIWAIAPLFPTITLDDSSLNDNTAGGSGGAIFAGGHHVVAIDTSFNRNTAGGDGGAIADADGIDVIDSCFIKNTAGANGGGFNVLTGDVSIYLGWFEGNVASLGDGGGFNADGVGAVSIIDTTVACNTATGDGGGFNVAAEQFNMTGSTLNGNRSGGFGGGANIATDGGVLGSTSSIINSTISGNTAAQGGGGGLNFAGATTLDVLDIVFATIAFNSSLEGGGIRLASGFMSIQNTIISNNNAPTGPDMHQVLGSLFADLGNNLVLNDTELLFSPDGVNGNVIGHDPLLKPLAWNGGPTRTHALKSTSPAIAAATPVLGITTDQRGVTRDAVAPTIGAYEFVNQPYNHKKWC
jgi:fibronectin-binding autotransporter adhesin